MAELRGGVPISSVQLPAGAVGEAAAEMLLAVMDGREPPRIAPLGPLHVIPRESTGVACTGDPVVAKALAYMSANVAKPGENQLASALDISVRHLRARFVEALGRSPAVVWRRLQLEAAQRLLLSADMKIDDVALQCGYGGASQFIRAFKSATGRTPVQWRRAARVSTH